MEDSSFVGQFFAFQVLFEDKVLTPDEVFAKIDKVTVEDVYREAARLFEPGRLNLGIIGPFKDKSIFEKLLK